MQLYFISSLVFAICYALSAVQAQDPAVVARVEKYDFAVNTTSQIAIKRTISSAGAPFLTLHFSEFHLAEGDKVTITSSDGLTKYEYSGLGRGGLGQSGGFYSSWVPGSDAIIEYIPSGSAAATGEFGFKIDQLTRSTNTASTSSVCGTDDSKAAKCFVNDTSLPLAYEKGRAVARLFVNGVESCTGWLLGSEGHLITNHHCIGTAAEAATTDFEFDAESSGCQDECKVKNGCRGTLAATSANLITVNEELDYALVKLDATVDLSSYGFLRLRVNGAVQGEQIYLPQHPKGWAKRITATGDNGDVTRAEQVDAAGVCGKHRLLYTADTQPGSSGSPVIAASDNTVIGLHNCGGLEAVCVNGAIDIRAIIYDLKAKNIVPRDALDDASAQLKDGPWLPGATSVPTPAPTPKPTQNICTIFRQQTSCEKTVPGNKCIWQNGSCVPNSAPVATSAPTTVK